MGKQISVTENGKSQVAKKLFITDENRIYRKAKKAFRTVNGVHRLVYSSRVVWGKYSCEVKAGEYFLDSDNSLVGTTHIMRTELGDEVYSDYEFNPSEGFVGVEPVTVESEDDAIGRYIVEPSEVYVIKDMWNTETADYCGQYSDSYSCGTEMYGTIEAEDGVLPESGTLIDGSANGSYCVLDINGELYYYIKQ